MKRPTDDSGIYGAALIMRNVAAQVRELRPTVPAGPVETPENRAAAELVLKGLTALLDSATDAQRELQAAVDELQGHLGEVQT